MTGSNDSYLGHPIDVKRFIEDHGKEIQKKITYMIIGKKNRTVEQYESTEDSVDFSLTTRKSNLNFSRDYGHVDILTDKNAEKDHYPLILNWLKERRYRKSI